jgi:hypothetical protein
MPRIPCGDLSNHVYHVLNRGNGGATVFTKDGDYRAFLTLLADAKTRYPVKIFVSASCRTIFILWCNPRPAPRLVTSCNGVLPVMCDATIATTKVMVMYGKGASRAF